MADMDTATDRVAHPTAQKLVSHFGGIRQTAEAFGLHRETVRLWLERGLPLDRVIEIEERSEGVVTAEEIIRERKAA